MTAPARVDRALLRQFVTGSPKLGEYPNALWGQVEQWRRDLLTECRARGVTVALTGSTDAPVHAPVPTVLSDVAAQLGERWPDPSRTDGRSWTLGEAIEQVRLCCLALDAVDSPATPPSSDPGGGSGASGWTALPVMTSAASSGERSSFQSAVPTFGPDGMTVSLPARGDRPGTPNPTVGGGTQRCEISLAGWGSMSGTQFLRYDFTLADGFPTQTDTWQTIAQLKNSSTGSPPLELMVGKGGRVYLQWHDKAGNETGTEYLGSATTGVRHSVVLKVPFTTSGNAPVSGWFDGKAAFTDRSHGPTMYPGQGVYGKLGLYRSNSIGVPATITHHGVAKGSTFEAVVPGKPADPGADPGTGTTQPSAPDQPYRKTCDLPYGSFPVGGSGWVATQGVWGAKTAQCIETVGARGFRVTKADHDKNGVAAYPSVWAGGAWADGSGAKGWKSARVRDLGELVTSARIALPPGNWKGNAGAFDLWFDRDPGKHDGLEMMLWMHTQDVAPAGSKVGTLSAGGAGWDVWKGTVGGVPVLSYVRQQNTLALDKLPLQPFMSDAIARGLLGPEWYLTSPQIGAELWKGGTGFALLDWAFGVA